MDDEERAPDAAGAGGIDAGAELLAEQQARIAALRAAVLSGQVPDDEASFDYARFFGGAATGDAPER